MNISAIRRKDYKERNQRNFVREGFVWTGWGQELAEVCGYKQIRDAHRVEVPLWWEEFLDEVGLIKPDYVSMRECLETDGLEILQECSRQGRVTPEAEVWLTMMRLQG